MKPDPASHVPTEGCATPGLPSQGDAPPLKPLLMLDHDGVVIDSFDVYATALIDACRRAGVAGVLAPDDVLRLFEGNVFAGLRALGADDRALAEILRRCALTLRNALPWLRPFPLMPQLLDELGDTHHLVVVTASDEELVRAFLQRYRVTGVAEVAGAQAGESKAVKIRALLERFPDPRGPWFVTETAGDVREALLAGVRPCGVAWGWHDPQELLAAGAEAIAETPAALPAILAPGAAADFWD